MTLRHLRLLTALVVVLALALPATGLADKGRRTVDRGVVQSVASEQIVLRSLDGNVQTFAVTPQTRIRLNGRAAALADVQPGFVASIAHEGDGPALAIQAFGTVAVVTDRGIVTAITPTAVTVRLAGDVVVTFTLDAATRFRLQGTPTRRLLARPGALVAVQHAPNGPARVVNVIKRAGG